MEQEFGEFDKSEEKAKDFGSFSKQENESFVENLNDCEGVVKNLDSKETVAVQSIKSNENNHQASPNGKDVSVQLGDEKPNRKNKKKGKIKVKKTATEKLNSVLLVLSVLAVFYAITYSFAGLIFLIPAVLLWIVWFAIVAVMSTITVFTIWASQEFRDFIKKFMSFNESISNPSSKISSIVYNIFPYLLAFFALCLVTYLIVCISEYQKRKGEKKYKLKIVGAVALIIVFIIASVVDVLFYLETVI